MNNVTYEIFENLCKIIDIPFNVTDCNLKLSTGKAPVIELTKIIEDCKNLEEKKEKLILILQLIMQSSFLRIKTDAALLLERL